MRIARNLCLYRRRSEPGCFVPDERLFPPVHQAIPAAYLHRQRDRPVAGHRPHAGSHLQFATRSREHAPRDRAAGHHRAATRRVDAADRRRLRPAAAHAGDPGIQVPQVAPRPGVGGYRLRARAPDRDPRPTATTDRGGQPAPLAPQSGQRRLQRWGPRRRHARTLPAGRHPDRDGSSPTHA